MSNTSKKEKIIVFTSSNNKKVTEEEYKETLLKVLQIQYDRAVKGK